MPSNQISNKLLPNRSTYFFKDGDRLFALNDALEKMFDGKDKITTWYYFKYFYYLSAMRLAEKHCKVSQKTIVDMCCCTGNIAYLYDKLILASYTYKQYIGVELRQKALDKAHVGKKIQYLNESAINTSIEDKTADVVFALEAFEHFDKKSGDDFLKEVSRILKDNGVFIMTTPNANNVDKVKDKPWYDNHSHMYGYEELLKMLSDNRLKVIHSHCVYAREKTIKRHIPYETYAIYSQLKDMIPSVLLKSIFQTFVPVGRSMNNIYVCIKGEGILYKKKRGLFQNLERCKNG